MYTEPAVIKLLLASVSFLLLHQRAAAVVVAIVVGALVAAIVDSYPGYVAIIPEGPCTLTMELGPKNTIPILVLGT